MWTEVTVHLGCKSWFIVLHGLGTVSYFLSKSFVFICPYPQQEKYDPHPQTTITEISRTSGRTEWGDAQVALNTVLGPWVGLSEY